MESGLPAYVRQDVVRGSSEHFFHFLIGYLLPIVHAQSQNHFERFQVLDCGPMMTPLLEQTLDRLQFDYQVIAEGGVRNPVAVEHWDLEIRTGRPEGMFAAAESVRRAWEEYSCPRQDCPTSGKLLIRRSDPHPFYTDGSAIIGGYGTSRRAIINLGEVSRWLDKAGIEHCIYEPGVHSLGCQIACFGSATHLLGMRGAEWANLVWTRRDPRVRILDPDPPAEFLSGLLAALGIPHEIEAVRGPHARENPLDAQRFLTGL